MSEPLDRSLELQRRRERQKSERYYLDLQGNERALLDAASRIYAAHLARGTDADLDTDRLIGRAVHEAVKIAYTIERSVTDVEEQRGR